MDIFVKDFGLVSDAEKVQTAAIQLAIDECAATGGGTVHFESGLYRTGTIYLRSNTSLHLPHMCTLKGSDDLADYNASDAWEQNMIVPSEKIYGQHLIVILEVDNCSIWGGGTIDGNGRHFGFENREDFVRPAQMVYLCESSNIRLTDLNLVNSTYWSCFVHGCENVTIHGLRIRNNPDIQNSDGIDIDTSRRVTVSDCIIQTQDDCITFRCDNGVFSHLKDTTKILEDVTVTNCHLSTKGCNAMRIGVGNGAIRNCQVSNIVIRDSAKGVCLESRYVFNSDEQPGVLIENISFQNIFMECKLPVYLASYCEGINALYAPPIRNIRFSGLTVESEHNIVVQANPNCVVENIVFRDVIMKLQGSPDCVDRYGYGEWDYVTSPAAFYIANAEGVLLDGIRVKVENEASPIIYGAISDSAQVDFGTFAAIKGAERLACIERGR
ncbi:MAG: hypothetical protein IJO88_04640 [Oscillospiraceae bacterium]|nr:hypothetical protein [Oscillospiraceae bacterium]